MSKEHWNIQIRVQRVIKQEAPPRASSSQSPQTERETIEVLNLAIVADDEMSAYAKARKMLEASTPDWLEATKEGRQ